MSQSPAKRQSRRRHVVAAGVFDGLHAGHRYYLRAAKRFGHKLTVIIARDQTVQAVKNKTPRYSERQRRAAVAALPEVDRAVLGKPLRTNEAGARFTFLLQLKPDVICLGYDQPVKTPALRRFLNTHGLRRTRIVRARKAPASNKKVLPSGG